jgi:hypothetical protein
MKLATFAADALPLYRVALSKVQRQSIPAKLAACRKGAMHLFKLHSQGTLQ